MLNYSRQELIGKKLSDIDLNYSPKARKERLRDMRKDPTTRVETEYITGDGEEFFVQVTGRYVNYQGRGFEIAFVEDITERKERQKELESIRKRLEMMAKNIDQAFFLMKADHSEILYFNQATIDLYGISPGELYSDPLAWTKNVVQEDFKDIIEPYLSRVTKNKFKKPVTLEYKIENTGEDIKYLKNRLYPVENNGELEHIIGVSEDITEEKQAKKKLENSLREKETLLSEVHHRVKNNLFLIISILDMQQLQSENPELKKALIKSTNRIHSMALIHQKIYGGGSIKELDFAEYIQELVNNLMNSFQLPDQNIEVEYKVDSAPMDLDQIIPCGLVVNELVSNAFQHGFDKKKEGKLWVTYGLDEGEYIIVIENNGRPLPFEFEITEDSSLGLKLVKKLVCNQLGGNIEIKNDQKVVFDISFPAEREN